MSTLYRLWNANHILLYVGVTENLDRRLAEHAADKPWWPEVVQTSSETLPSMRRALEAEARAIFWEQPRYNVLGSPRYSANWEARCHALEDAEAARLALPDLTEDDYRWLAPALKRLADAGFTDEAKRIYELLDILHTRSRAS